MLHRLASECRVVLFASCRVDSFGRILDDPSVAADDRSSWEVQLAPPQHVGEIAEGTDHGDASALVDLRQFVRADRHFDIEQRSAHGGAEEWLVPLVVGMCDECDACGNQFGASGGDDDIARSVRAFEGHVVICAWAFSIFEFGLRNGGAEVDVPQGRRFLRVCLTTSKVAQERCLRCLAGVIADGGVQQAPVHGEAESAEEILEDLLVLVRQLFTQGNEVWSRDCHGTVILRHVAAERGRECGVERHGWVARDAVVVLHAPFGGQAVVVPAHRIEHRLAPHSPEAGERVGVRVGEHMAHVQRTTDGGRWSVDGEHVVARCRSIE